MYLAIPVTASSLVVWEASSRTPFTGVRSVPRVFTKRVLTPCVWTPRHFFLPRSPCAPASRGSYPPRPPLLSRDAENARPMPRAATADLEDVLFREK